MTRVWEGGGEEEKEREEGHDEGFSEGGRGEESTMGPATRRQMHPVFPETYYTFASP